MVLKQGGGDITRAVEYLHRFDDPLMQLSGLRTKVERTLASDVRDLHRKPIHGIISVLQHWYEATGMPKKYSDIYTSIFPKL